MAEPTAPRRLGDRLRELRTASSPPVTQRNVADALGASTALISSWESGSAVPPEWRLEVYARFFGARRAGAGPSHLVPAADLTPDERRQTNALVEELFRLREDVTRPPDQASRATGALGGRFWHFPDQQSITILCTPLSRRQLGLNPDGTLPDDAPPITAYARQSHPNYIRSLGNGDIDALVELVGHIRAENPTAEVRWNTFDVHRSDDLTGHLVVLGGAERSHPSDPTSTTPTEWFVERLDLPLRTRLPAGGDEEFDTEFIVTTDDDGDPAYQGPREEIYRPRFVRTESAPERPRVRVDGAPQLEYDVAFIARKANPLNLSARITICSGVFTRGTYGAVRTFTDAKLRARNERYITEHFADPDDFWMVVQVPVYGGETITPDLERPFHRLRMSS